MAVVQVAVPKELVEREAESAERVAGLGMVATVKEPARIPSSNDELMERCKCGDAILNAVICGGSAWFRLTQSIVEYE